MRHQVLIAVHPGPAAALLVACLLADNLFGGRQRPLAELTLQPGRRSPFVANTEEMLIQDLAAFIDTESAAQEVGNVVEVFRVCETHS